MKTQFQNKIESLPIGVTTLLIDGFWMELEKKKKGRIKLWRKITFLGRLTVYCFIQKVESDRIICKDTSNQNCEFSINQIKFKQKDGTYKTL